VITLTPHLSSDIVRHGANLGEGRVTTPDSGVRRTSSQEQRDSTCRSSGRRRKRQQRSWQKQQLQSADFHHNGYNANGNDDGVGEMMSVGSGPSAVQFPTQADPSPASFSETVDSRNTNDAPDSGDNRRWSAPSGHEADSEAQEKQKQQGTGRGEAPNGEKQEVTFKPVAGEGVRNKSRSNTDDADAHVRRARSGSAAHASLSRGEDHAVEYGRHGRVAGELNVGDRARGKGFGLREAASVESRFRRRRRRKSKDSDANNAVLGPGQKGHPVADMPVSPTQNRFRQYTHLPAGVQAKYE